MLVKVNKLFFLVDFIVLDIEEDRKVPLILGRPFLATSKTLIDVQQGKLTLRVQDEEVSFNVFKAMKYPSNNDECYYIDIVDKVTTETFEKDTTAKSMHHTFSHKHRREF